jgi:molybdate transport system substrate-binding protein
MATRRLLIAAGEARCRKGGAPLALQAVGGVEAARRVRDGEPFDLVVLAADAIDTLTAAGRVVADGRTALARSSVAIAVRRGAARAAIDSEQALRDSVLKARAIGYSTGPSGAALQQLFARWGIGEVLRERLVQAPPGVPVAALLADGTVSLGFQQFSELIHVEGIDVIGPMPPGLEIVTTFAGAVCTLSRQPDAVRALLDFLHSGACDAARQRHGLDHPGACP